MVSEDREVVRGGFSGLDTWLDPLELRWREGTGVVGVLGVFHCLEIQRTPSETLPPR